MPADLSVTCTSYSQFGEDRKVAEFFGENFKGLFLEVGSADGVRDSNTLLLEQRGWAGVLVEADPELAVRASVRERSVVHNAVVGAGESVSLAVFYRISGGPENLSGLASVSLTGALESHVERHGGRIEEIRVKATTLDAIWGESGFHRSPDFVSIDVEGAELEALKGFDIERHRPRLVLVEDNSYDRDRRVHDWLKRAGYRRVHRTGVNDWYVNQNEAVPFRKERIVLAYRLFRWRVGRMVRRMTNKR